MKQTIMIKNAALPCYPTMGGLVFFKRATGKNVTDISGEEDLIALCFAQTKAACKSDGIDFPFADVDDFACSLSPEEFALWCTDLAETETAAETEGSRSKKKKSPPKSKS